MSQVKIGKIWGGAQKTWGTNSWPSCFFFLFFPLNETYFDKSQLAGKLQKTENLRRSRPRLPDTREDFTVEASISLEKSLPLPHTTFQGQSIKNLQIFLEIHVKPCSLPTKPWPGSVLESGSVVQIELGSYIHVPFLASYFSNMPPKITILAARDYAQVLIGMSPFLWRSIKLLTFKIGWAFARDPVSCVTCMIMWGQQIHKEGINVSISPF